MMHLSDLVDFRHQLFTRFPFFAPFYLFNHIEKSNSNFSPPFYRSLQHLPSLFSSCRYLHAHTDAHITDLNTYNLLSIQFRQKFI